MDSATSTNPIPLSELEAQAPFLRRLARALVRTEADAEDLVQDTWTLALQRSPRPAESVRGWLARLARNAARSTRRGAERRTRRESLAASPLAHADGPEETEVAERVLAAVLALDDPYREVVLQRYYQNLSSAEIARRTRAAPRTVETRLRRARARLRERLDGDFGGRAAWGAALGIFAGLEAPTRFGAGAVAAAGLAAALVGGLAVWRWSPPAEAEGGAEGPAVAAVLGAGALERGARQPIDPGESAAAASAPALEPRDPGEAAEPEPAAGAPQPAPPQAEPAPPETFPLRGSLAGGPWNDAWVSALRIGEREESDYLATPCGDDGGFALDVPTSWGKSVVLVVVAEGREPSETHTYLAERTRRLLLRVGGVGDFAAGEVIDERDEPLPGAEVELRRVGGRRQYEFSVGPYELTLDPDLCYRTARTRVDELGRFELHGLKHGAYRALVAPPAQAAFGTELMLADQRSGQRVELPRADLVLRPTLSELLVEVSGTEPGSEHGATATVGERSLLRKAEKLLGSLARDVSKSRLASWRKIEAKLDEDGAVARPLRADLPLRVLFDPRADLGVLLRSGSYGAGYLDPTRAKTDARGRVTVALQAD